ncbi:MAG: hypothetical protein AAFZ18_26905 [Myxococcota bacterium]
MCTSRFDLRFGLTVALLAAGSACTIEPAEFRFGNQVTGIEFQLFSPDMGIFPNQDVLADPNNPFAYTGVGAETKWELLALGGNAGAFYAWATLLATQPNGEHQFYTALLLDQIFQTQEVPEEQLSVVRSMAIRGYQSVLDHFPDSVTFDARGTVANRLATPAYQGIVGLGAAPAGDWVLVDSPSGPQAVRGSNSLVLPDDEEGS